MPDGSLIDCVDQAKQEIPIPRFAKIAAKSSDGLHQVFANGNQAADIVKGEQHVGIEGRLKDRIESVSIVVDPILV
jgi:hypothetical protein